jgi:hypothetical protein
MRAEGLYCPRLGIEIGEQGKEVLWAVLAFSAGVVGMGSIKSCVSYIVRREQYTIGR